MSRHRTLPERAWEDLARDAYMAYGDEVGWKNYAGLPMPTWEKLTDAIRNAWCAATRKTFMTAVESVQRVAKADQPG